MGGASDDSVELTGPADVKKWLELRIQPTLGSLHDRLIRWVEGTAFNTRVILPGKATSLPPQAHGDVLSSVRQDLGVAFAWAKNRGLANLPPLPPVFQNREEAQAVYSEWRAYFERLEAAAQEAGQDKEPEMGFHTLLPTKKPATD